MIKVKDGYAKLIGTTYEGSSTNVLLSDGGNFPIHSSRNNEANKLVRTDSNGLLHTGWINTTSGDLGGAITRIYCSNDSYIRYQTPANFFSSLTNSGNNISITVAGLNRTLQVGYASNSDRVDNRHAISTTPNTGILYKSALYTPASLSSYWVKLASISSIGLNAEFVATIHVLSGHANLGRSAILLVYLRGDKSSFMSKSFKICCNSNYDPSRFRLYYRDSDKTSEIWYLTIGRWDGIITTVISQSDEGALYEGLTLYNGHINVVLTPSMSSYITALVSTITDNISGNATTASQLLTSRTLWGLSFNGTANVSGSLTGVGDITSTGFHLRGYNTTNPLLRLSNDAVENSYFQLSPGGKLSMDFGMASGKNITLLYSNGYVGIGTTSPSHKLHVVGNTYVSGSFTAGSYVYSQNGWFQNNKSGTGLYNSANDARWYANSNGWYADKSATFAGYVTSTGFKKSGSSDSYVLLGGGGHKTIDSFLTNYDGRYVKKSGDMMTGTLTTYTNGSNNCNQGIRINRLAFSNWATLTIGYVGTSTGGTSGNTWLIGTPANSNSLIFTRNGASETSGLCLKGGGNTDIRWNGNTVWHAGNDGSGSGLDSDMLDGQHASAFSYKSWWHWSGLSGQPSWIWGGNSENNYYVYNPSNFSVNYAKSAGNADTLDNWHLSYILKDGYITSGTAGLASYWIKMWDYTLNSLYNDIDITLYVHSAYNLLWGIIALRLRLNGTGTARNITANLTEIIGNIPSDRFRLYYNNSNGLCLLWGNVSGLYNVFNYRVLAKTWRTATESTAIGTFYTSSITTAQTLPADSYVTITNLSLVNNTATSTKLQTARKINGTSFDGTSDITTSAWGATRTISLTGAVTGSVLTNGSGNITISTTYGTGNITNLDNRYLKKTGDTMNGTLSFSPKGSSDAAPKIYSTVSGDLTSLNFEIADDSNDRFVFRINYYNDTDTTNRERFIINWNNVVSKAPITAPSFKGNATSATQLLTSRKINGTSFNGTANITTSYWGSTRTLTIGNTGKSVNGSGNVSWSLSEIGAASSSHTHGTLHSTFTTKLNNTTTDSGWSMINSSYNGFLLKSIRTQLSAPDWIENNYAAGICFGGDDTKGVLSIAYSSPAIRFAGGNGTKPVWWVRLTGASGATYNLANMWTGTRYWANIAVSTSSSTSTSPTFSSCYTSNWFRSEGKTGWYSQTYGGGWYMTDSTWLRSFNNKGVVAKCFYASDWSSSTYLLRSDGGAAAFHWSGQSGQPSWVWGGNNLHQYYVYNPSNFSVNYAKSAGNADTLDGLHSTHYFRKYNRSDMGSSMNLNTLKTFGIFEVRTSEITTTNSPMSGYYPLLNFVNGEHVLIQIAGTTGNLFYRATQTANVGTSAEFTPSWAAFIDNTNYTSYIKKIGTSTVGGTDRPIYLSSGTPTPISSTKGSASLPVYLNAGTITACTPSSVFSNLSNSGTKLSISVAGQNRTLTVMYATSTLYVVSSGRQTALSGTTAANSGIRLYEAYNNGYPISYGNLLSMKGRGSTELLMGWKSGANRMYYRSNSDINEGWTGWSTVATLADISNAVKTGTTGHLAYYSSTSSISSFNSNVGNPYTPIYLSSGVPKPCNGVIFKSIGKYLFTYTNSATNPGTGSYTYTQSGYNYPNIIKVSVNTTGSITIEFNRSIMNAIIGGNGVGSILSPDGNRYGGYISIGFKSGDTSVDVITKNESGRLTVSFYLYVMEF